MNPKKNTHNFSKFEKFIWNWFQLKKTFSIDINKYFQWFENASIVVKIEMENLLKIFISDDQPLAKFVRFSKIFVKGQHQCSSIDFWTYFFGLKER